MVTGLVLTGGGARGAWQAGVVRALGEITAGPLPFQVVTGTSAGAINAMWVAAHAVARGESADGLAAMWASLLMPRIFRTDAGTMARIGAAWLADLGLGGVLGAGRGKALLDTSPLRTTLDGMIDMSAIGAAVADGTLRGAAVSATSYDRGLGVTFFDAAPNVAPWARRTRLGERATLRIDHVLASSAIPVFFPAVDIGGEWYGDGCVRMDTPLSPAIHLGAERILAIGIRAPRAHVAPETSAYPSKARVASLLLDALFLDALDSDVERALRINRTVALLGPERRPATTLRTLPILMLQPSRDLGDLGRDALGTFPAILRHLLGGLGASEREGWDLVSYLAFEPGYIEPLLDLGYRDAMARRAEIEAFLAA